MKRYVKILGVLVLSGILFVSGFQLYDIYRDKKASDDIFHELKNQIHNQDQNNNQEQSSNQEENNDQGQSHKQETNGDSTQASVQLPSSGYLTEKEQKEILFQFQKIVKRNQDFIGWISIEGTSINYPVMQTIDRPEYYLTRDFNGNYNRHGVPFAAETCNVTAPSDNITIYGHHMNDGTMFSDLDKYKQQEYFKNHPIVQFNTLASCNQYQIIAAFKTVAYSGEGFHYYEFHDAENEAQFNEYVSQVKKRAFYETGYTAKYGDKLITLSTCEYSQKNGRVVVVAKLIQK